MVGLSCPLTVSVAIDVAESRAKDYVCCPNERAVVLYVQVAVGVSVDWPDEPAS